MLRISTASALANAFGVSKNGFQDGNPATATPATAFNAAWCHAIQEELAEFIEACGFTLSGATFKQLAGAIQSGHLNIAIAGGTSDVLTATFPLPITTLSFGMGVLLVRASAANTTTTPTINVGSGALTIVKSNNQALAVGDISGAGHWMLLMYDSVNANMVLLNPSQVNAQTRTNYTVSGGSPQRSYGGVYYNLTTQKIKVMVSTANSTNAAMSLQINSTTVAWIGASSTGGEEVCLSFDVLPGESYSITNLGSAALGYWTEIR